MSGGTTAVLGYAGTSVGVRTTDPLDLDWLIEFLAPWAGVVPGLRPECSVEVRADPMAFTEAYRLGPHRTAGREPCFNFDSQVLEHARWIAPDERTRLFDERFQAFYTVDAGARRIEILVPAAGGRSRIALLRVVREVMMLHRQRCGDLVIHGAAFVDGRHGVILAGAKRAGKTSLLIHALRARGSRFVSNDRVLVTRAPHGVRMLGLPTVVSVRSGTLDLFPRLRSRLRQCGYRERLTLEEARETPSPPPARDDVPYALSPAQFCDVLGVDPAQGASPTAIVFPEIDGDASPMSAERLSQEAAASALSRTLFALLAHHPFDFGDGLAAAGRAQELCRGLVQRLPCFSYRIGHHAYRRSAQDEVPSWLLSPIEAATNHA